MWTLAAEVTTRIPNAQSAATCRLSILEGGGLGMDLGKAQNVRLGKLGKALPGKAQKAQLLVI